MNINNYSALETRYDHMHYRKCGNSGLKLPALSLGMWHNFGGIDPYEKSRNILLKAFDSGITHFDLANNYGPPYGSAEETMGQLLSKDLKKYRDELIISSKAGYDMWPGPYGIGGSKKYIIASCNQSLKRMGIDYVDIFYSHRYDPETPLEETMQTLSQLVSQGKALYIGLSNYAPREAEKAIDILENLGTPCLIHQPKYSLLVRTPEEGLLNLLQKKGVGCIAFSPLAQGLLTSRYLKNIPEDSRMAKNNRFLTKENLSDTLKNKLIKLNTIAKERNQTLAQMALSWLLEKNAITSVLIGASTVSQLEENLKTLNNIHFTSSELDLIEKTILK